MAAQPRQLHLNAFLRNIGQHEAAWRLPETRISAITDIDHYIDLALIAERGKLDAIFFAGHPVLKGKTEFRPFDALDPFTLVTALSGATSTIGLVATASTTYNDPYSLARRFATLDHVSKGRAGWNVVTTANADAAANFGYPNHRRLHRPRPREESTVMATRAGDLTVENGSPATGYGDAVAVVHNLTRSFGARPVLDAVNLTIHQGEFVALLGRSGSGFQDSRLLPWARVLDNVTLGLAGRDIAARGTAVLSDVGLPGTGTRVAL